MVTRRVEHPDEPSTELCTVSDAARTLGVSPSTVWRWIDGGKLPALRVGPKAIRIRRRDVEAAIQPVTKTTMQSTMDHIYTNVADALRPLTPDERRRFKASIKALDALREEIRIRRNGKPLSDSTVIIRQARDERSRRL